MLRLNEDHIDIMRKQASATFPNEACGFLVGKRSAEGDLLVSDIVTCQNTSSMPVQRFELDSELHLKLQRETREKGLEILGCFHSHPKGPARPSLEDLSRAVVPEWVWVILGEVDGRPMGMRAFVLEAPNAEDKRFVPLAVSVDTLVV